MKKNTFDTPLKGVFSVYTTDIPLLPFGKRAPRADVHAAPCARMRTPLRFLQMWLRRAQTVKI